MNMCARAHGSNSSRAHRLDHPTVAKTKTDDKQLAKIMLLNKVCSYHLLLPPRSEWKSEHEWESRWSQRSKSPFASKHHPLFFNNMFCW